MKGNGTEDSLNNISPFATSSAAAAYRVGEDAYIDLIFMRTYFVIDNVNNSSAIIEGKTELHSQKAEMHSARVSSVTMTVEQARTMIEAVQHQLKELAKK